MVAVNKYSTEDKEYFQTHGIIYDDCKKHYYCDTCEKSITSPLKHIDDNITHEEKFKTFSENHVYEIPKFNDLFLRESVSYDEKEKKYHCYCCNVFTLNPNEHIKKINHMYKIEEIYKENDVNDYSYYNDYDDE